MYKDVKSIIIIVIKGFYSIGISDYFIKELGKYIFIYYNIVKGKSKFIKTNYC